MDEARAFLDGLISRPTTADHRRRRQRGSATALRWVTVVGAFVICWWSGGSPGPSCAIRASSPRRAATSRRSTPAWRSASRAHGRPRQANEEIQRFAYIVTHDLRAPLVNIMGFTSELEASLGTLQAYMSGHDDGDEPRGKEARRAATEDLPEAIGFIRSSTRKMDGLINAILKMSREGRRELKPEAIDLPALTRPRRGRPSPGQRGRRRRHDRPADAPPDLRPAVAGADVRQPVRQCRQVPGRRAAAEHRHPRRLPRQPRRHRVRRQRPRHRGQDHERVFELFRRSGAQDKPGEGIGLAHVRSMVRNLGGDITVPSELGHGTTFIVTLPRDLRN